MPYQNLFGSLKEPVSEQFIKEYYFFLVQEHFINLKNLFPI